LFLKTELAASNRKSKGYVRKLNRQALKGTVAGKRNGLFLLISVFLEKCLHEAEAFTQILRFRDTLKLP